MTLLIACLLIHGLHLGWPYYPLAVGVWCLQAYLHRGEISGLMDMQKDIRSARLAAENARCMVPVCRFQRESRHG